MKVKIKENMNTIQGCRWYLSGQVYDVVDYRHNPREYYELKGWKGRIKEPYEYWIIKKDCYVLQEFADIEGLFEL